MFSDYSALVLKDFRKKRDTGELSPNLTRSTPAKLRDECLAVLAARFSPNDEKTLRIFFGPRTSMAEYEHAIRRFEVSKFKPLNNFLLGETASTVDKNIELLAWLIDFHPRPYGANHSVKQEPELTTTSQPNAPLPTSADSVPVRPEKKLLKSILTENHTGVDEELRETKNTLPGNRKRPAILLAVLVMTGAIAYFVLTNFLAPQKCMYWTGEHYEPVSCNEKIEGAPVLALDAAKVKDFRKITQTDTITYNSLGYVWYSKIDNELEFFTADGYHPVHNERKLKPLSKYMIAKYLKGGKNVLQKRVNDADVGHLFAQ